MKPPFVVRIRRGGRRRKPKDVVLGAAVQTSLTHPMHWDITAAREAAGYTQPEFLRILIERGLQSWKAEHPLSGSANQDAEGITADAILSTTEEYDATG
jgi:hypothetical protein